MEKTKQNKKQQVAGLHTEAKQKIFLVPFFVLLFLKQ